MQVPKSWLLCLTLTVLAGCAGTPVCRILSPPASAPRDVVWTSCPLVEEDGTEIGIAVSQSPGPVERGSPGELVLLSTEEFIAIADRALGSQHGVGGVVAGEMIWFYGSPRHIHVYEHAVIRAWWDRDWHDGHKGVSRFEIFPFRVVVGTIDAVGNAVADADGVGNGVADADGVGDAVANSEGVRPELMALFSSTVENFFTPSGLVAFVVIDRQRYVAALSDVSVSWLGQVRQLRVAGPL